MHQFGTFKIARSCSFCLSVSALCLHSLVNARGYYEEFDQEVLCDGSSGGRQEQTDAREVPEVGGCKVQYAQERKGEGRGGEGKGGEGRGEDGRADMDDINCNE